jgi:hypothetical protein
MEEIAHREAARDELLQEIRLNHDRFKTHDSLTKTAVSIGLILGLRLDYLITLLDQSSASGTSIEVQT